jgi:hypothetical protein
MQVNSISGYLPGRIVFFLVCYRLWWDRCFLLCLVETLPSFVSLVTFCCLVLPWFFPFILQAAQSGSSVNMVEVRLGWQQRIITQLKDGRFVVVVWLYWLWRIQANCTLLSIDFWKFENRSFFFGFTGEYTHHTSANFVDPSWWESRQHKRSHWWWSASEVLQLFWVLYHMIFTFP